MHCGLGDLYVNDPRFAVSNLERSRRWRYQDLLLVPARTPLSPTARGIRLTFSAHGTDLDALVAQARAAGGGSVEGPAATPWNTLDVLAHDPDGYDVVFTAMLPPHLQDPEFAHRMEQVKQQVSFFNEGVYDHIHGAHPHKGIGGEIPNAPFLDTIKGYVIAPYAEQEASAVSETPNDPCCPSGNGSSRACCLAQRQ